MVHARLMYKMRVDRLGVIEMCSHQKAEAWDGSASKLCVRDAPF